MPRKTRWDAAVTLAVRAASMRPRPDAAENADRGPGSRADRRRFNEAAARCRGKPGTTAAIVPIFVTLQ